MTVPCFLDMYHDDHVFCFFFVLDIYHDDNTVVFKWETLYVHLFLKIPWKNQIKIVVQEYDINHHIMGLQQGVCIEKNTVEVNGDQTLLPTFFKLCSFVFLRREKVVSI